MVTTGDESCLIGYRPEEAEAFAAEHGLTIVWIDAIPPRWLPPRHEPRVGRQRLLSDGRLELLRVLAPSIYHSAGVPPEP